MNLNHNPALSFQSPLLNDVKRMIIVSGLFFFAMSLFQTALFTSGDDIRGYWVLIMGWFGLLFFQLSWFANPINLLALLLSSSKPRTSLLLSILAFALAAQTFQFTEIPVGLNNEKIYIKELGLGFYLWFFAQGLFLTSILIEVFSGISLKKP